MARGLKNTIGASIGTALEFYDYTLYGIFAITFAPLFFPEKETSTVFSLIIYALSSFLRPFGGILFGHLSDTHGRKLALMTSVFIMAISTFAMGCLPVYADLGIYSLVFLIILRCLQGISAGGEYNNTTIYSFESNARYSGLYSSIVVASVTVGTLIAMFLSSFILKLSYEHAWRIPFILGGVVGFFGLYYRQYLTESPAFEKQSDSKISSQLKKIFCQHKVAFMKTILVGGFSSILALTIYHYINMYLNGVIGFDVSKSALVSTIGISFCLFFIPIFGYLVDLIHPRKILFISALITFFFSYVIYHLLSSGEIHQIIIAQFFVALLSSSISAAAHPYLINLFPPKVRCLGISFGFTLGIAIFGGTMPLISNTLIQITKNIKSPCIYLNIMSLLVIAILVPIPSKKDIRKISDFLLFRSREPAS